MFFPNYFIKLSKSALWFFMEVFMVSYAEFKVSCPALSNLVVNLVSIIFRFSL